MTLPTKQKTEQRAYKRETKLPKNVMYYFLLHAKKCNSQSTLFTPTNSALNNNNKSYWTL